MLDKSILDNNLNDQVSYQEFFKALGYGINEKVFLRLFDDSKTNKADTGSKLDQDLGLFGNIVNHLKAENAKRRGVYFVVNGGGQTDNAVKKSGCCKAQFFEIDDNSFDEQIDKINQFIEKTNLEPSIIVKTKKSLHCYFLLKDGDIHQFRQVQLQLITEMKSDPVIQNESRVMRLYGFNHCKQEPPTLVKLIKFTPELRYNQDEISKALPPPDPNISKGKGKQKAAGAAKIDKSADFVPKGQRHFYVVSKIGEVLNLIGDTVDDQAILALIETDLLSKCEDPGGIDLENDFRPKYLRTIAQLRAQHDAEQKDPKFYSYALRAWKEENPGKEFNKDVVSWNEIREAGERAKQAGKEFKENPGNTAAAAAMPNIEEPAIGGKINKPFFHQWDTYSKVPKPKRPFDSRIRDYVPKLFNIMIFSGIPWIYVKGKWIPDETTAKTRHLIEMFLLDEFKTDSNIRNIYNLILHTATFEKSWKDVNKQPKTWVNFKDCYLDLSDLTEHEHKAEYYTLNQIDLNWSDIKAAGTGEETEKFLNFAIPAADDREMLLEYYGYSLTADNRQQKTLLLYGTGGTGKSTILNLEKTILGDTNISSVAFQDIGSRFKPSRLVGKLANICGDLPTGSIKDASIFKQLVGEDNIDTERKNKDGFSFKSYAKMIYSTNGLPIIEGERSTGTFRRLLVIPFQQVPTVKDPLLPEKLNTEILYFCRLIIEAANRMYQRGYIQESANSERDLKQLRCDSDVSQAWLDECTNTEDRHHKAKRQDLYTSFEMYCESEKRIALKPNSFYAALRAKGFREYRSQNERGFYGIFPNYGLRKY